MFRKRLQLCLPVEIKDSLLPSSSICCHCCLSGLGVSAPNNLSWFNLSVQVIVKQSGSLLARGSCLLEGMYFKGDTLLFTMNSLQLHEKN